MPDSYSYYRVVISPESTHIAAYKRCLEYLNAVFLSIRKTIEISRRIGKTKKAEVTESDTQNRKGGKLCYIICLLGKQIIS